MRQSLLRWLLCAVACAGLIASVRFAVFPPRGGVASTVRPSPPVADRGAEGYAVLFVRRYLTWNADDPQASDRLLGPMTGSEMALDAGVTLPTDGTQQVAWAEVVQQREPGPGAHVYTVAAQTDNAGLLYLAVSVVRMSDGSLALSGYPAFVGAPAERGAQLPAHAPAVNDAGLAAVVTRALRNYLAAAPDELAADLAEGAHVAVPRNALTLETMQSLGWSSDRRSVLAVVQARDVRGARYTLGYELDVADVSGRWEVSALEMDPNQ
ncbi:MAG: conjugal transfer protein [Solirubrobacterales bacterium]